MTDFTIQSANSDNIIITSTNEFAVEAITGIGPQGPQGPQGPHTHGVADLTATGTRNATTYLDRKSVV